MTDEYYLAYDKNRDCNPRDDLHLIKVLGNSHLIIGNVIPSYRITRLTDDNPAPDIRLEKLPVIWYVNQLDAARDEYLKWRKEWININQAVIDAGAVRHTCDKCGHKSG